MVTARSFPYLGGVETHTYEVSRRLAAHGHHVTVLSTDTEGRLPRDEEAEGVRTIRVPAWPKRGGLYVAPAVFSAIGRSSWDVIHVQGYHTFVPPVAMAAAIRSKIPFVVTFHSGGHSSTLRHSIRGFQQRALSPLLKRADLLIGVSEFEAAMFRKRLNLPASRFVVVPNGAQLPDVDPAAAEPPQPDLILSVGRLERYKGHQRAIAAMPEVLRTRPEAALHIVGTGPFEGELREQAARLGVSHRVRIGSVAAADRAAMAHAFQRSSLVLLLSEYEAHPVSVMEALGLGRPVLVTYTTGLAELADRGLVRAVPLDAGASVIADAIVQSLDNPLVPPPVSLPTWDDCVQRLTEVYEEVTRRRSGQAALAY